jgi:hypothetical protein
MDSAVSETKALKDDEQLKELASLARLVAFARQNAKELNADFPAYCLDLALSALLQDISGGGAGSTIGDDELRLVVTAGAVH